LTAEFEEYCHVDGNQDGKCMWNMRLYPDGTVNIKVDIEYARSKKRLKTLTVCNGKELDSIEASFHSIAEIIFREYINGHV